MAGKLASLIVLASAFAAFSAEDRPPVDPLAGATPKPEHGRGPQGPNGPNGPGMRRGPGSFGGRDSEKARQALEQMNPEDRQRVMQRLKEFADLPPEKKKELFERSEYFRRKMREDVEAAMKETGLTLSDEQKKKFAERYFEERKGIEEELRKQMEEFRRPKLKALADKLKQEFAAQSPAPQ